MNVLRTEHGAQVKVDCGSVLLVQPMILGETVLKSEKSSVVSEIKMNFYRELLATTAHERKKNEQ